MGPIILLFVLGLSLFIAVPLITALIRERQRTQERMSSAVVPVNLIDNNNAVVVAEGRGHLVFANDKARHWFGMNGGEPNLEIMAQQIKPSDTFLELFGKEGQASFRLGQRRIEATSHYIPKQDTQQLVVVMRELTSATFDKTELDPARAMSVVSEITQTISASLRLDDTLNAILDSIGSVIEFDAGEITLWDEDLQILRPLGRGGATQHSYYEKFDSTDGVYHLDDSFSGWVARYRQPLLIADVKTRPDVHPKITDYPFLSYIGVPLMVSDRFIGTLELGSRKRAAFDHEDMALLQAVAGQAGIAIENAQLYQNQAERVAELSGLQQIAQAMGSFTDQRQMYGQLAMRIAGLMNVEMCGILLYDAEQRALLSQAPFHGVPDAIIALYRIPLVEDGPAYKIWQARDWWYSNSVLSDDLVRALGLLNLAEVLGIRSTALVPMSVGTRRIGVVQASNKRDNSGFSDDDMRLMAVFASQTAIVVENARLYTEEQRRAAELGGLQQISQAIGVLHDPGELYGQISERIAKLMNVQMCGVMLFNAERNMLEGQVPFHGIDPELVPYYELSVPPGSPMHLLYTERDSWYVNDMQAEAMVRTSGLDKLGSLVGMRQTLIVPLIAGGQRLGILQASNRLNGQEFTDEDARVLSVFASQAAVIIDNARLYNEMQTRATEAEGLRRIAEIASSTVTIEQIIGQIIAETARLFECRVVAVSMLDQTVGKLTMRPEMTFGLPLTEPMSIDIYTTGLQNSTALSKRPFLSNDITNDSRVLPVYRAMAERFGLKNIIQVALIIREQGVGDLLVANRHNKANVDFKQADQRLLQAVAVQIAAAVERSQLYQATDADLRARIGELDALSRVSNELNLTIQLERILEVIRYEAQRTTEAKVATVLLLKAPDEWPAPDKPLIEQRLGGSKAMADELLLIEEKAILDNQVVHISDYHDSSLDTKPLGMRSGLAAPIQFGGQVTGVIHVYSDTMDAFKPRNVEFIQALANQAAVAVGNAVRYRQQLERNELLKQRADQLSQIFELGRMLRSEASLEGILDAVAHGVTDAVGFNIVLISLVDRPTRTLRRFAQAGIALTEFHEMQKQAPLVDQIEALFQPKYRMSASYFLPGEEADSWKVSDVPFNEHISPIQPSTVRGWHHHDLMLVPLRGSNGDLIGLMSVDEPRDGKRPSLSTIEALEIFANQAAFAVENYTLLQAYQQEGEATRRERDRLAQLHLVASEIQRAADVPSRLQVVADGIHAAGWGRVSITLRDVNLEPRELITSGYSPDELAKLKANLLPGIVWRQRLSDPDFRKFRIGQAYYLRYSDQWVTENKLMGTADVRMTPQPLEDDDPEQWHRQDIVYLPLYGLDQSRVIGIISMDSPTDGKPPTETSMRPIELFAAQAASAIENTRLYQETTRAAQQEAHLNAVMEAVSSTLDTNEIIASVAKGLQQLIPYTRMSMALLDWAEREFEMLSVNIDIRTNEIAVKPAEKIEIENTALGRAYRDLTGRVYHATDVDLLSGYHDLESWRASGERTSLIVPLIAGGRALGALHMGSELAEAFGFDEQLPLVQRMANLTAVSIENARLFQQAIDRERFSAAIGRIGQSINAILDLSKVLDAVCNEIVGLLHVAGAYIWLVEGEDLVGFAGQGAGADQFSGTRIALSDSGHLATAAIRDRGATFVNNFAAQTQYRTILRDVPVQAQLVVPLLREDRAVGVLVLVQTNAARSFSPSDLDRASAFAGQAVIAIENARLYQQTLGLTAFNESIVQSIQQGIIVLDKDTRIRTINGYMKQNYAWDDSAVGQLLFEYRPVYRDFLGTAIEAMANGQQPEPAYNVRGLSEQGALVVRNFYTYPLLQAESINGAVILVEDVTERSALEEDLQERAGELTALTEASSKLTATLEPDAVVQLLIDELGRLLRYDNVTLWLRQGAKLVIREARGYPGAEALKGIEAEIADSALFREIAQRGQVLNIPDVTKDSRFPASAERPTRSWLGIALNTKNNLSGLLVLEKTEANFYRPTQEQLGLAFANQAAVALENARLFQQRDQAADENTQLYQETRRRAAELNQQAQRLALLNRISSALAQSLDIENVFSVTISELVKALNMDRGGAVLLEPEQKRGRLVIEYPSQEPSSQAVYIPTDNNPLFDRMRQTMKPLAISNIYQDVPEGVIRDLLVQRGILSTIFIPLAVGGQLIGTIGIDSTDEYHVFTPDQIELAQTIASQAAIAVQNASLFEQSVVRTRELETLFEATQATSATLDLDEVMRNAARQMLPALGADSCTIAMLDDVEDRLELHIEVATQDGKETVSEPHVWIPVADYPARGRAISARQVVILYADEPGLDALESQSMAERKAAARLLLPMIVREQVIGLIMVDMTDPTRRLGTAEVRLARALTSQASVAVDNARLQTETTYKLQELFIINELATALASSIEQEQIFRVIHDQLPLVTEAEMLLLAVYDEETGQVSYPVVVRHGKDMAVAAHSLADDEVSYVIKRRMPLLLAGDDVQEVLRIFGITLRITKAKSYIAVPLVTGDAIVGALALADETSTRAFGLDDQRVLTTIASQLSVSIQNSRLFERNRRFTAELEGRVQERTEELRHERDRLNFLYRITTGLTASLDMDQVLTRALEMMASAVGADMGAILGIDTISDNLMYRATYGFKDHAMSNLITFTQHEGLAGWVIQYQQSVIVNNVQDDPRWLHRSEMDDEPRSAIAALLEANEDILGVVMLYSHQKDQFNDDHLRLVTAAAGQIAAAMNNADLYGLIREQAERLGAMVRREQVDATKNAAIVESIADGVMVADPSGEIIQFNSAAERILGLPRRQVIGHDISDLAGLYAASGGQRWLNALQSWMEDPTQHRPGDSIQEQLQLDNDKVVSVVLSPVNMGDQFLGTVSVFRDISREIEVDRMKSEFVATVSHELRTPMTSIKGYADLLLLGAAGEVTEQQQRFLGTIKTNADRLSVLVNELLDISRIDRGVVKLNFQPTDVEEVISSGLAHLRGRIENDKKDIHISSEIAPGLPLINGDFDKITQILNNLLDNAFNYTYPGGSVRVSAKADGDGLVISVADTGVGIPPENQSRIFERFFRGEDNQLVMETSGTGLGLSIVKEYVKMHDGQIWLESAPGKGTTFFVRLPIITETTRQQAS